MPEWNLEIQLGLTQVLALNAAIVTFLLSRLNTLSALADQERLLRAIRSRGYHGREAIQAWYLRILELAIRAGVVISAGVVFFETNHYLAIVGLLVGKLAMVDLGVLERLRAHLGTVRHDTIESGFVALVIMLFDVAISFLLHPIVVDKSAVTEDYHPFALPGAYRGAILSLWRSRMREVQGTSATVDYVSNWSEWASSVTRFHEENYSKCLRQHLKAVAANAPL